MPLSTTNFISARGNQVVYNSNSLKTDGKYDYVKSLQIANYFTEGETVKIVYTVHPSIPINVSYYYTFDRNMDTFSTLHTLNDANDFEGFIFDYDGIYSSGTTEGTIKFSSGIAIRLGYDENAEYSITPTSPLLSVHGAIEAEPQYFTLNYNSEDLLIKGVYSTTTYFTNYPIFRRVDNNSPRVDLKDDRGNTINIPYTVQITRIDDDGLDDVNFRSVGITKIRDEINQYILTTVSDIYALQKILINDNQKFTGHESMHVFNHDVDLFDVGYYIDTNYHISNVGDKLNDTTYNRGFILAYSRTDYIAIPWSIGLVPDISNHTINTLKQFPGTFTKSELIIPGTSFTIDAVRTTEILANKGYLTSERYTILDAISGVNVTITNDNTIEIDGGNHVLSFRSDHPSYISMFPISMNMFDDINEKIKTIAKDYTFNAPIKLGINYPSHYQIYFDIGNNIFTTAETQLIEWNKNLGSNNINNIYIDSINFLGQPIRRLNSNEWRAVFLHKLWYSI